MKYDWEKTSEMAAIIGKAMGFIQAHATIFKIEKNHRADEFERMYEELKTQFNNIYNKTTHETTN